MGSPWAVRLDLGLDDKARPPTFSSDGPLYRLLPDGPGASGTACSFRLLFSSLSLSFRKQGEMKTGGKVIFLCRDARGYGPAIFEGLHPSPNSSLQTSKESFDLSLERYGIKDTKASGDILNFTDSQGLSQVSVILLQNYEPPVSICAVNEVLASIMAEKSSDVPTLIVPLFVSAQKVNREMANLTQTNQKGAIYGAQVGFKTDFTEGLTGGIQEAPPSLQVSCEPLACLLQLVHVLKLPTVVLIGSVGQQQTGRIEDQEIEVLHELGELLASRLRLHFSKDTIHWDTKDKSQDAEEPWRALYG